MVKTKNLLLATSIIVVCVSAFFLLLASSSVPLFTVKQLMDHPQPEAYLNRKIQLIGVVDQINGANFSVSDPEDVTNETLIIFIEAVNVERPSGFEIGKQVLIEGKLITIGYIWKFKASSISTKCPTKY
ncbi:MAG: cytochrome c maturation protein CcmE [Candidatus Hodarchaeota archaeon]